MVFWAQIWICSTDLCLAQPFPPSFRRFLDRVVLILKPLRFRRHIDSKTKQKLNTFISS